MGSIYTVKRISNLQSALETYVSYGAMKNNLSAIACVREMLIKSQLCKQNCTFVKLFHMFWIMS